MGQIIYKNLFQIVFIFSGLLILLFLPISHIKAAELSPTINSHLLISQVYYFGSAENEWVEIYNPTKEAIDLSNYKIGDEETKGQGEGMYQFPDDLFLESDESLVIAQSAQKFYEKFNFLPNFEIKESNSAIDNLIKYSSWANGQMELADSGDEVIILNEQDELVDGLVWGDGNLPSHNSYKNAKQGSSLQRNLKLPDTNNCQSDFFEKSIVPDFQIYGLLISNSIINFNASPSFLSLNYQWQIEGDVNNYFEQQFSYSFSHASTYNITLTISNDNSDQIYQITKTIQITSDPRKIILNEILANPDGNDTGNEWVEIYNPTNYPIDLVNFKLMDLAGGVLELSGTINPNGYLAFHPSFTINNESEQIFLYYNDQLLDSVLFSDAQTGISFAKNIEGQWVWTKNPTPNSLNIIIDLIEDSEEYTPSSLSEIQKLPAKTKVIITGTVIVAPDTLSSQYFFIQDDNNGVMVYLYNKNFPKLSIGDLIQIQGEVTEYQGKKRITIHSSSDIEILANKSPPVPIRINCNQKADFYGQLVTVSGRISKISGQTVYINDGRGELKIIISSKSISKRPTMKKNDWVIISGIIDYSSENYVLRPRFLQDIQVKSIGTSSANKSATKSVSSKNSENILGVNTASAQSNEIQAGSDQREPNRNQSSLAVFIMIIAALILGIILTVFNIRRKIGKNYYF